ncbi:MAG: sugar transferase, partial [Saccharofermentans sp.]|nr:sugar transferase [Saccharofermentans sp.]
MLICPDDDNEYPSETIEALTSMGVTVHLRLNKAGKHVAVKQTVNNIGGLLVLTSAMNYVSPRQAIIKRIMDIIGGLIGTVITGILYLILAPMIKRESPGPVFFKQERLGRNGKPFKIYKFRSMYMDAEERKKELMEQNKIDGGLMFKMDFDPRIIGNKIDENGNKKTGIGQKIRDWSLDEFPQFINVLKGEMSLVGTRPPLMSEVEKYDAHHKARLGTMPGITGLWQVSGRSNILDFEEVVKLDTQYINNWSVGLDVKILFKTI